MDVNVWNLGQSLRGFFKLGLQLQVRLERITFNL